jgi:hypothetical protein
LSGLLRQGNSLIYLGLSRYFICPWNFTLDACVENSLYPAPKSAGNESENVDKMPLGFMMTVPADFNGDFNGKRDG